VLGDDGTLRLEPAAGGIAGALGQIAAGVYAAVADGVWERFKACDRDTCRWAFYDHSKNRSGRWCSMGVCGNREKSLRAYRRRQKSPVRPSASKTA
jgi:predicted RNA-binding Zn ribbon-like protein